ncbi:MAG: DUF4404 family protein [Herpetosiphonaceae bacterium]|nr:DUF4404 family protein [Herpetosiphonaceae bacterium]
MEQPQLRASLERLDTELSETTADEQERQAVLSNVHSDVQQLLAEPVAEQEDRHRSLRQQLIAAIPTFEATHPILTTTMIEVIDMLDRMGL